MRFEKLIFMDASYHLLGGLASTIAKSVLTTYQQPASSKMGFKKWIVIDVMGDPSGRLALTIAKSLFTGQRIGVVRCEQVNINGSFYRNKLEYLDFSLKRTNTKPSRGPFHSSAPSRIEWRTVRGMIPQKTKGGAEVMQAEQDKSDDPKSVNEVLESYGYGYSHQQK